MSAPFWAVPGAKVVCVDDAIHNEWRMPGIDYHENMNGLRAKVVYTIRDTLTDPVDGSFCIRLVEIIRPISEASGVETGYRASRFRPVSTKTIEDDVAQFKHLLNTTHIGEDA